MRPKAAIIIPFHNEARTLQAVIEAVLRTGVASRIIAVDDGSTDGSAQILSGMTEARPDVVTGLKHPVRRGKGAAIRTALREVVEDVVIIQDADLEYNPEDIPAILDRFSDPEIQAVYGSRNLRRNPRSTQAFYWGGRLLSWVTSLLYKARITDEATGYKAVRTSVIKSLGLQEDGFEFCPEITARLLKAKVPIVEVPVSYRPRSFEEGKKIRWHHGLKALWLLFALRFSRENGNAAGQVQAASPETSFWLLTIAPLLVIALSVGLAWMNSLDAPFLMDDEGSILTNSTLDPPLDSSVLRPPSDQGQTVGGRPFLNLSLALNVWMDGREPAGFRVVNILIHILNASLLFLLARRSIGLLRGAKEPGRADVLFSMGCALLWAVHPLVTSAVTYIVQRAESLTALWYLLTLYAYARSLTAGKPGGWLALSLTACFLGMLSKEVMVTAPVAVVIYGYVFSGRGIKGTLKANPVYLGLLASSWIVLGFALASTGSRGGSAGLGLDISSWSYLKTQSWAILHYLKLTFWPFSQVFDYGRGFTITGFAGFAPGFLLLALLVCVGILGTVFRRPAGYLILMAFLILSPTSSIVPIADPVFEHRFYLPLACVVVLVTGLLRRFLGDRAFWVIPLITVCLGILTHLRNEDYLQPERLWRQSLAFNPENTRAHTNLGHLLLRDHKVTEALEHFELAAELDPGDALVLNNYANALDHVGDHARSIPVFRKAMELDPQSLRIRFALAQAYRASGDHGPATELYRDILSGHPDSVEAWRGLAKSLLKAGQTKAAIEAFAEVAERDPGNPVAYFEWGDALAQSGDLVAAREAFEKVIDLDPDNAEALLNLGNIALMQGDSGLAKSRFEKSASIRPTAMTLTNLAIVHIQEGRFEEARTSLQGALDLDPDHPQARNILRQMEQLQSEP